MSTLNLGIRMNQGDDFRLIILVTGDSGPIDISGYEFIGAMKKDTDPESEAVAEFDFTIFNQTTHKGQCLWSLSADEAADLIASVSDAERKNRLTTPYVFDVKMKDTADIVSRPIEGIIYLSPQVTVETFE